MRLSPACRLLCLAGLLAWRAGAAAPPAAPAVTADEYTVLSAVIAHGLPPDTREIVIAAQTTGDPSALARPDANIDELEKKLETPPGLLATWVALNRASSALETRLVLTPRYELLEDTLRGKIFDGDDPVAAWKRFHKHFPQAPGLLRVSRVALDEARMNALVYVEFACGADCGTGRLIRLNKSNGSWQVLSGELMWVAGE